MTVKEAADKLGGKILSDSGAECFSVYAGDFLSRVMGRAPENSLWVTVMGNINVAGVAVLADIKIIVIAEGALPDNALVEKCSEEGIGLITTDMGIYECCKVL